MRALTIVAAVGIAAAAGCTGAVLFSDQTDEHTFYVSASGSDTADGHSPSSAWKSISRVNEHELEPGDRILFEGGSTFRGLLHITATKATDPKFPVVVSSYGTGRATLANDNETAIYLNDVSAVTLQDLDVVGPGAEAAKFDGIALYNEHVGSKPREGVVIQRVSVSGFRHGIAVGAAEGAAGFSGLSVLDTSVRDNRLSGLLTYGPQFDPTKPYYAHENVHISGVEAAGNIGDPDVNQNSGSGIILGSVHGGRVDHSTAHHNGALSDAVEGPAGIWAYDSTNITIEHNLAFANKTTNSDGHGFDLDQNVSNSVLQYNLSYDNAGAGYMLFSNADNQTHTRNQIRFNISVNDGTFNGFYGAITLFGGLQGASSDTGIYDADVYHNTVIVAPSGKGKPPAVMVLGTMHDVRVLNNILVANSGAQLIRAKGFTTSGITFQGNAYYAAKTRNPFEWNGRFFSTLKAWRTASQQELLDGSPVGTEADPKLLEMKSPSSITSAQQVRNAAGFRLNQNSPAIGRGVDLRRLRIDRGREDYYADELPASSFDIGAAAYPKSG
jgi:hypothetical protein